MAENNLNNDPNANSLLASLNALYGALRGTVAPRDATGVVGAGLADLGSAINPWGRLYVGSIVAGDQAVDSAALATGSPVFPVIASGDVVWEISHTRCVVIALSGRGQDGSDSLSGTNGGATTATQGGTTISSGAGPGGELSDFSLGSRGIGIGVLSGLTAASVITAVIGANAVGGDSGLLILLGLP